MRLSSFNMQVCAYIPYSEPALQVIFPAEYPRDIL
jgi:hypothetical protein